MMLLLLECQSFQIFHYVANQLVALVFFLVMIFICLKICLVKVTCISKVIVIIIFPNTFLTVEQNWSLKHMLIYEAFVFER